jgi:hypothetical protein
MVSLAPSTARRPAFALDRDGLICAGAALVVFALMLADPRVLADGDSWWHLATGQWILAHGRVPTVDPFSFTHAGQPWTAHEWLSEVLMALAYRVGGWSGVLVLSGAGLALAAGWLGQGLRRSLSGLGLALALILGLALGAGSFLARPHALAAPLVVLWLDQLILARRAGAAPPLWLAATMALWANLHGSFVFGFLLAAPFALEALLAARPGVWPAVRAWGVFGAAAVAAALCNPSGPHAFVYPLQILDMRTLGSIREWLPQDFARPGLFELVLLAVLFAGLSRGVRIAPLRLALLLLLLHMGLQHHRHELVLGLTAPLLLAGPFAAAAEVWPPPPATNRLPMVLALGCGLVFAALRLANPVVRGDEPNTPASALAHVPAGLARQPVLNSYDFGGYLIFQGVRPFIDGRSDMYGDALFRSHIAMTGGDLAAFDEAAQRYGLAWTLLRPDEPLATALDHHTGWRPLYRDRWAVIHVRAPTPQNTAAQTASN